MSFTQPARGSRTRSGGKANVKTETTYSEVNVLGNGQEKGSAVAHGQKRSADEIDAPGDENGDPSVDYSKLTVKELNEMIKDRDLKKNGAKLKSELVALLEIADKNPTEDASEDASGDAEDKKGIVAVAPSEITSSSAGPSKPAAKKQKKEPAAPKPKRSKKPKPEPYVEPEEWDPVDHNAVASGEVRCRDYVPFPDKDLHNKIWKAQNERMFMLGRTKGLDGYGNAEETFLISGSTGNVYTVVFNRSPTCNCINARMGNKQRCKHVIYVKLNILKVTGTLIHQVGYLSSEVEQIFADAPKTQLPVIPNDQIEDEANHNGKRKPADGDCPICVMEFEENEELVWCKAACGQNFHKDCFDQYKSHANNHNIKCAYCRTPWQDSDDPYSNLIQSAPKVGGFRNIGHLPMYKTESGDSGSGA